MEVDCKMVGKEFVPIGVTKDQKQKLKLKKLELAAELKRDMTYGDVIDYLFNRLTKQPRSIVHMQEQQWEEIPELETEGKLGQMLHRKNEILARIAVGVPL